MSEKRQTITVVRIVDGRLEDLSTRDYLDRIMRGLSGTRDLEITVTSEPIPEPIEVTLRYTGSSQSTVPGLSRWAAAVLNDMVLDGEPWEPVD